MLFQTNDDPLGAYEVPDDTQDLLARANVAVLNNRLELERLRRNRLLAELEVDA